jgi:hypothetical protein
LGYRIREHVATAGGIGARIAADMVMVTAVGAAGYTVVHTALYTVDAAEYAAEYAAESGADRIRIKTQMHCSSLDVFEVICFVISH